MVESDNQSASSIHGFDEAELALLQGARIATRCFERQQVLLGPHDAGQVILLIREGWAARISDIEDDEVQYLDLLSAGDLCGLASAMLGGGCHRIDALTPVMAECYDASSAIALAAAHPRLAAAMLRHSLRQTAMARAGQRRLGRRRADQRLAILLHDVAVRMEWTARIDGVVVLPLSQSDLAAATGLTAIHVNRVLRGWQAAGTVVLARRSVGVIDRAALEEIGGIDAALHE